MYPFQYRFVAALLVFTLFLSLSAEEDPEVIFLKNRQEILRNTCSVKDGYIFSVGVSNNPSSSLADRISLVSAEANLAYILLQKDGIKVACEKHGYDFCKMVLQNWMLLKKIKIEARGGEVISNFTENGVRYKVLAFPKSNVSFPELGTISWNDICTELKSQPDKVNSLLLFEISSDMSVSDFEKRYGRFMSIQFGDVFTKMFFGKTVSHKDNLNTERKALILKTISFDSNLSQVIAVANQYPYDIKVIQILEKKFNDNFLSRCSAQMKYVASCEYKKQDQEKTNDLIAPEEKNTMAYPDIQKSSKFDSNL